MNGITDRSSPKSLELAPGVRLFSGYFAPDRQKELLAAVDAVVAQAPFFRPTMPRSGKPFSVEMTNCGTLGWVADVAGYRYQPRHPETDRPWPPIPAMLMAVWRAVGAPEVPEACLINRYGAGARMGLHQDRDEDAFDAPVVSVSLGDTAVFRFGGTTRRGKTQSIRLQSGDVLVFGGPARLMYHGVDRTLAGSSTVLPSGGRLNLTLRRVHPWGETS